MELKNKLKFIGRGRYFVPVCIHSRNLEVEKMEENAQNAKPDDGRAGTGFQQVTRRDRSPW